MRWDWTEADVQAAMGGKNAEGSDGKRKKVVKLEDVVVEVDRHARILGRKEELAG